MNHKLIFTGNAKQQFINGECSCGNWGQYINLSGKGGITKLAKESIALNFKSHKVGA